MVRGLTRLYHTLVGLRSQTLLVALALVLSASSFLDSHAQSQQTPTGRDRNQTQSQSQHKQPATSNQQGTEQSPVVVRIQPSQKTETETAEEQKERSEKAELDRKLVNFNGDLAFYTKLLFLVAVIQSGALLVQAYFLAGTLRATAKAASVAKDALTTTERAFVFLEDFDSDQIYQPNSGNCLRLLLKPPWRNNGTTPTRNMTVSVNWTEFMGELPTG